MKYRLAALAGLFLLGAAAPQQGESIGGDVRSWGKIVKSFEVTPQGEVRYTIAEQDGGFFEYWLVTRRARPGSEAYRKIAGLTAKARALAGKPWKCGPGATDGPYGELRHGAARVGFNSSCTAAETDTVAAAIHDSLALADEWAKGGEIVGREWKGPPKQ